MKGIVKKKEEYYRRIRKILTTKLNAKNKIINSLIFIKDKVIDSLTIPVLTYGFGIIQWLKSEIEKIDRILLWVKQDIETWVYDWSGWKFVRPVTWSNAYDILQSFICHYIRRPTIHGNPFSYGFSDSIKFALLHWLCLFFQLHQCWLMLRRLSIGRFHQIIPSNKWVFAKQP